jgi:hypothetical protein
MFVLHSLNRRHASWEQEEHRCCVMFLAISHNSAILLPASVSAMHDFLLVISKHEGGGLFQNQTIPRCEHAMRQE